MAYEEIGNVRLITLGGYNKKTRVDNPTSLEGYLIRSEQIDDKFNPGKTKNMYVFKTAEGEVGVIAPSRLDQRLKTASSGAMTLIEFKGEEDTGKGNPVKLFKVSQDKQNVDSSAPASFGSQEPEDDDFEEESPPPPAKASPRSTPPTSATTSRVAELLKKRN